MENKNIKPKKLSYSKYDASLAYLSAVLSPQMLAIFFVTIISFVSIFLNVNNIETSPVYIIVLSFASPIAFFLTYFFVSKSSNVSMKKTLNLKHNISIIKIFLCFAIAAICVFGFNNFISMFDAIVALTGFKGDYSLMLPLSNFYWYLLSIFLFAVLPAIFEELVFRGVIFGGLKKYSVKTAIILSSVLFALVHGQIEQLIYPILLGVILAVVMHKTNNLLYPILLHFFNNAIVITYNYIQTTVSASVSASAFSLTVSNILLAILFAVLAAAAIVLILLFLFKNKAKEKTLTDEIKEKSITVQKNEDENTKTNVDVNESESVKETIRNKNAKIILLVSISISIFLFIFDLISGFIA